MPGGPETASEPDLTVSTLSVDKSLRVEAAQDEKSGEFGEKALPWSNMLSAPGWQSRFRRCETLFNKVLRPSPATHAPDPDPRRIGADNSCRRASENGTNTGAIRQVRRWLR